MCRAASPYPYGLRTSNERDASRALLTRGAFERERVTFAGVLAPAARIPGTRFPDFGWLHGSGQLGHRHCRRFAVWLHTAVRHHALEPDGDPVAESLAQAGRGHGARPGAVVSRELWAQGELRALGWS